MANTASIKSNMQQFSSENAFRRYSLLFLFTKYKIAEIRIAAAITAMLHSYFETHSISNKVTNNYC